MAKAGPPSEERKARTRGNRGRGSTPSARKPLVSDKPKFDMEPNVDAIEGNSPINRTETEHTNNQGTDVDMQEVIVGCGDISGVSEDHENDEDSNSTVSTSDSSSSEDDSGDDEEIELENENGMCHYELMRQRRIARNEERLAGLGLSQIQKSTVMVVKKPTRSSKPLPQGPRRTLPGRKGRAQFFETMKTVTKVKEKVVEEEKNPEACDVCQSEEGELLYCEYCTKRYHPDCHKPPITSTNSSSNIADSKVDGDKESSPGHDKSNNEFSFRCADCEASNRTRRVACGQCAGCKRTTDCMTCVNCVRRIAGANAPKCIFRKCRSWGKGKVVKDSGESGSQVDPGFDENGTVDVILKQSNNDGHSDQCDVCKEGGDLILCDSCPRAFHSNCHVPKLHALPEGNWDCMHCRRSKAKKHIQDKNFKVKKQKYTGKLTADVNGKAVVCTIRFPKIHCVLCDGEEVTGVHRPPDWAFCRTCNDWYHCKCLSPPLENRPNKWRCPPCREINAVPKDEKPLFEGEHSDWCYVCDDGGDLVCCDYCEKSFHLNCHIPALSDIPRGNWKCCECAAVEYKRKMKCGECEACLREDCGKCLHCKDKPKFGGPGKMKQTCMLRNCPYKRFAPPASQTPKPVSKKELQRKFEEASTSNTRKRKRNDSPPQHPVTTPKTHKKDRNGEETASAAYIAQQTPRSLAVKTPRRSPSIINNPIKVEESVNSDQNETKIKTEEPPIPTTTPKKKRGRPRKYPRIEDSTKTNDGPHAPESSPVACKTNSLKKKNIIKREDIKGSKMKSIINKALKQSSDSKMQDKACENIRKLINSAEDAEKLIRLGGLKMIANAMRSHPSVTLVLAEANCTLSELLWKNSKCVPDIIREGILPLVIESMQQHGTHLKVQQMACGFWRSMSYDFQEHATIYRFNGVQAVVDSMKRNPTKFEILQEGCFFIQNIVCNPEVSCDTVNIIVANGIVPIVVDAVASFPTKNDFIEAACGALTNLAIDENIRSTIGQYSSTIPTILSILDSDSLERDVLRSSLSALKVLAKENEANKKMIVNAGAIDRVLNFLKQHTDDDYLVARGFGLLIELTRNETDIIEAIINLDGLFDLVISEMKKRPGSVHIQAGGCGMLRNLPLAKKEQAQTAMILALEAMKNHSEDSMVQFEGCHALLWYSSKFPELASMLQSAENSRVLFKSHLRYDIPPSTSDDET